MLKRLPDRLYRLIETQIETRPMLLAAIILLLLALIYAWPAIGISPGYVFGDLDMPGAYYVWFEQTRDALRAGRLPIWDETFFAGAPFLGNPQTGLYYPPAWIFLLIPTNIAVGLLLALHLAFAGLGMVWLARRMGAGWLWALLAGLSYAFGGHMSARIHGGHLPVIEVLAWIPWSVAALGWAIDSGRTTAALIAGLPLAGALLAGHVASVVHLLLLWIGFLLYWSLENPRERAWLVIRQSLLAGVMGVALSAVLLLPLAQMLLFTERVAEASYDYAAQFSLPPAHLITLLIPEFFGEPVRTGYWSVPNFVELTYYVGVLPLLGLALALRRPRRQAWLLLGLTALGLLLALGQYTPFHRLAMKAFPVLELLRGAGRSALLYSFSMPLLLATSAHGWAELDEGTRRREIGGLLRYLLPVLGIAGIAGLAATGAVFMALHPTDTSGRLWAQVGGWSLATFFLLGGGGLLWAWFSAEAGSLRRRGAGFGLLALLLIDLWTFGAKFVIRTPISFDPVFERAAAIIGPTEDRVLPWGVSVFSQNLIRATGLRSVYGYSGLELATMQAFTASVPDPRATTFDILNVRYVVAYDPLDPSYLEGERPLTLIGQDERSFVYERPRVMPPAWWVGSYELFPDQSALLNRIHSPGFDPATLALFTGDPACLAQPGLASVEVLERQPGYWRIAVESDQPGLLIVSEVSYLGWRAAIDGQRTQSLDAYGVVRAVCVPAGEHLVEWRFLPEASMVGAGLSAAALLLLGIAVWRQKRALA